MKHVYTSIVGMYIHISVSNITMQHVIHIHTYVRVPFQMHMFTYTHGHTRTHTHIDHPMITQLQACHVCQMIIQHLKVCVVRWLLTFCLIVLCL